VKEIPGLRTYVAVDGGMSDNLRPVTYGAQYEAFSPRARRRDARRW
jgi:diaminopimelate decarboxylase